MLIRLSGAAGVAAGAVMLSGFVANIGGVVDLDPTLNLYRILTFYLLALAGLVGIHLRQVSVRPGLAWFGFAAALPGITLGGFAATLAAAGMPESPFARGEFVFVAGVALWVGSAILGATMLAIRAFPMPVGLALTIASPLALIGLELHDPATAFGIPSGLSQVGLVLYGLAWIGAGISLLSAQRGGETLASSAR